jgi:hypothetical protein
LLKKTAASATGFTPAELMFGGNEPNIFENLPKAEPCQKTYRRRQSLREDSMENRRQKEKQKKEQSTLET